MDSSLWWILAAIFIAVFINYIGIRNVAENYKKNPSNKIFYIIGLFSIITVAYRFWDRNQSNNKLVSLIILFAITMAYTYVWEKSGFLYGTERYENTTAGKIIKFFGIIFIIVTSILVALLFAVLVGWITL